MRLRKLRAISFATARPPDSNCRRLPTRPAARTTLPAWRGGIPHRGVAGAALLQARQIPFLSRRDGTPMARQFIYHMQGLTKTYPTGKKVLDNVHLSFYPDAKIGVLGINGSGKSTLLRIMAGIDTEFQGEGFVAEGRARRLPAAGAAARREPRRARQRHARRQGEEGDPRPLQRTRHELFRRDRGRDDRPAGRDRGAGPVGSRLAGRAGDGCARLPAGRLPT